MIFDLHCHPSFKTFLGNRVPDLRQDCWTTLNFDLDFNILDSQSSLTQIKIGGGRLVVCTLYALENAFAASGLIKLAAGLSPHVEKQFIREIHREEFGYRELMLGDYAHLMASGELSHEKSFKFLSSMDEYQEDFPGLQILLSVEGGHNFYADKQNPGAHGDILNSIRIHKQNANMRLLYITLTHLQQSAFCTHAYGMKIIKNRKFIPVGNGITGLGKSFIREALSSQNGREIYLDIKHMSLKSRKAYYRLHRQEFPDIPIIASHMGITGVSHTRKPVRKTQYNLKKQCVEVFYYRPPGLADTYFNPWSINLYDEDIREIMLSGGLIGLSLDQRILGCGRVSKELFSHQEFRPAEFGFTKRPKYHVLAQGHHNTPDKLKNWQMRHFCNNWLHAVKIGRQTIGDDAWDHICIGSDFDGLINPIDDITSASDYTFLHERLVEWLPPMAKAAGLLLEPSHVKHRISGLLFSNALRFLKVHYR